MGENIFHDFFTTFFQVSFFLKKIKKKENKVVVLLLLFCWLLFSLSIFELNIQILIQYIEVDSLKSK
jgi:4-amino-4-deoxy-L-arabinose transferase-like glycosyltransferase